MIHTMKRHFPATVAGAVLLFCFSTPVNAQERTITIVHSGTGYGATHWEATSNALIRLTLDIKLNAPVNARIIHKGPIHFSGRRSEVTGEWQKTAQQKIIYAPLLPAPFGNFLPFF